MVSHDKGSSLERRSDCLSVLTKLVQICAHNFFFFGFRTIMQPAITTRKSNFSDSLTGTALFLALVESYTVSTGQSHAVHLLHEARPACPAYLGR